MYLAFEKLTGTLSKPQKNNISILGGSEAQPNQERSLSPSQKAGVIYSAQ